MSEITNLCVAEFLLKERENLIKTEERIRLEPMPYEHKILILEKLVKNGISYGIKKGIFLEQERIKKISRAKEKRLDNYVDELIFDINDRMARYRNQPKIKYAKRKYRMRKKKGGTQLELSFTNEF